MTRGVRGPSFGRRVRSRQAGAGLWSTLVAIVLLLGAAVAIGAYVYLQQALQRPLETGNAVFTVERGQSLRSFAAELQEAGIIEEAYSLLALPASARWISCSRLESTWLLAPMARHPTMIWI